MNQADVRKIPMADSNCDLAVAQAIALIKSYSFDTNGNPAETLVQQWLDHYQGNWVRLAAIEALYLGRYKSVSIEQIMAVWFRIGTPNIHFKGEFERLICRKLPKYLAMSDSFWFETDEYISSFEENSNSEYIQYSQSRNFLGSKSSSSAELEFPKSHQTKTVPDAKNIFTPEQTITLEQSLSSSCSTKITNFNPILDKSSFFAKLKSLALANT